MEKHIQEWWDGLSGYKMDELLDKYPPSKNPLQLPTKEQTITHIYNMEHKEETVEEAAKKHAKISSIQKFRNEFDEGVEIGIESGFQSGASWQKEKDDELIRELKERLSNALNYLNVFMIRDEEPLVGENLKTDLYNTKTSIQKANKHLNNG